MQSRCTCTFPDSVHFSDSKKATFGILNPFLCPYTIYICNHMYVSSITIPASLSNLLCLVALNFQTPCMEMDVNQGRFLPNGLSGYILKPTYLRDGATEFDPVTLIKGEWLQHKTLHVMVRLEATVSVTFSVAANALMIQHLFRS